MTFKKRRMDLPQGPVCLSAKICDEQISHPMVAGS